MSDHACHLSSTNGNASEVATPNMLTPVSTAPTSVSRPNTSVRYGPAQAFSKSASERGREADRYKIEEVGQPPRASGAYLNSV